MVCESILRGDREQLESAMDKMIIIKKKMIINLDVFGLFMENIIMNNLNGTPIITIKGSDR